MMEAQELRFKEHFGERTVVSSLSTTYFFALQEPKGKASRNAFSTRIAPRHDVFRTVSHKTSYASEATKYAALSAHQRSLQPRSTKRDNTGRAQGRLNAYTRQHLSLSSGHQRIDCGRSRPLFRSGGQDLGAAHIHVHSLAHSAYIWPLLLKA